MLCSAQSHLSLYSLSRVNEKMSNGQQYSYNETYEILNEIYKIKQSLLSGTLGYTCKITCFGFIFRKSTPIALQC